MLILLLIFIVIPLAEIAVFIQVGGIIGLWATIALVVVTAIIGTSLLRWQGYGVLARTQTALNNGELPVTSVIDGVFLLVAGALLLTPGLITDTFGFLLFIPQFRRFLANVIFKQMIKKGKVRMSMYSENTRFEGDPFSQQGGAAGEKGRDNSPIIDVEYTDIDEEKKDSSDKNGKPGQSGSSSPWRQKP